MAPVKCYYSNCTNTSVNKSLFKFPTNDLDRLQLWIKNSGNVTLSSLTYKELNNRFICEDHFVASDISINAARPRLIYKAIPKAYDPVLPKRNDEAITYKCVLCDKKGVEPSSEELVLSRFPLDPAICRTWIKRVGLKELLGIPFQKLNETMFLCQKHFNPECFKKKDDLIILKDTATPSSDLYYPPLPEELMSVVSEEDQTGSYPNLTDIKAENILMNDESQDFNNVEYLEDDSYRDADIFENVELRDDNRAHNVNPTIAIHEQSLSTDEIDNLFSSYMVTFRKFPAKLQTMLKFDLAILFARYEMKNATIQSVSDEQQQAMDDTPSAIVSEETETAEKNKKRKFSQPQPYIMTNKPKTLTYSKIMMPKSRVSHKDNESATYKSSSKEKPLLNNVAIIKTRVIDSEDNDTVVLKTNDQYQKPIKVCKLEEESSKEFETARRLSSCQDSQGTSTIVITDRSSKKLTTESDKISQSQNSAS